MSYVAWALLGMVAYSTTTLLVKLAMRSGGLTIFAVLSIATAIVAVAAAANAMIGGHFRATSVADFGKPSALYAYAAGLALTIAVGSLFKGLSLGPASVVVPIYGMFILGGTVLGILFLGEPVTPSRSIGLVLAIIGVVLVAR